MNQVVVDASVAAKWYLPEVHSEKALILFDGSFQLSSPDLLFSEIGNLLWKRVIKKEFSQDKGMEILAALELVPLQVWESKALMPLAFDLACRTRITHYDGLYVALALSTEARLITADQKLFNALEKGPLGSLLMWIEDLK
jgi:predicted nucleic acid-binding protein